MGNNIGNQLITWENAGRNSEKEDLQPIENGSIGKSQLRSFLWLLLDMGSFMKVKLKYRCRFRDNFSWINF